MKPLENKRILFLSPAFFGYENKMKVKMQQMGAEVDAFDERSVKASFARALLKIEPDIFKAKTHKYYRGILDNKKKYDYVLIVKSDMVDNEVLQDIRSKYPDARLCLYLWDSVDNIPHIKDRMDLYDIKSSFDIKDCENIKDLRFRPLFFSDEYICKEKAHNEYKFDLAFCGTIHSDRYRIIKKISEQCRDLGYTMYLFNYLQSGYMFYFYKLLKPEFKGAIKKEFCFDKKSAVEISNIIARSRTILDIQHPNQTGLTMRTIEMIGMKKKLITTNETIKSYDFYDENNVCVIDRNNPIIDPVFLMTEYKEIDDAVYYKYSLENWVLDVLGIGEE